MKLRTLFEKIDVSPRQQRGDFRLQDEIEKKRLGKGIEAQAFQSKSPNAVIKVVNITTDLEYHAYTQYLKIIKNNPDNPFFPRIYKTRVYTAPKSERFGRKYYMVVHMEKLLPLERSNVIHNVGSLLKQIGIPKSYADHIVATDPYSRNYIDVDVSIKLADLFDNENTRREITNASKNPQFVEAMNEMEYLFQQFRSDLTANNFMIRITGHGPQLVITDPFYSERV